MLCGFARAFLAADALGLVVAKKIRVLGGDPAAAPAAGAFVAVKQYFLLPAPAFRIVAPEAGEGAALEKHGGADAGAVIDAKSLYVKNRSVHHF